VAGAVPKLATFQDLLGRGPSREEILGGEIVEKASPSPEHGRAQRAIGRYLGGPFDDDHERGGPGGWWILTEVAVELERHEVVLPDVAGWRRERLPNPWGQKPVRVPPDWICEVLSTSDERRDRVDKAALYARAGVAHYWMVAPSERLLEAFELRGGSWVRIGAWGDDASPVRIPRFEAIEIDVTRLFPPR
jgi:Uma2 family endonuclease